MNINTELQKALKEIGPISPWWSQSDEMFVFEHALYPWVMHADPDQNEAALGYKRALKGFIEERVNGAVAAKTDATTPGRGGFRTGSGRPRNKIKSLRVYLPEDIANWLDNPSHQEQVRRLMQA